MPKSETKIDKFKFIVGLFGEVVGLGMFYGVVVMGIFILCGGVEEKSTSLFIYIISAVVIGGAWLVLRIRKMQQGKYYLNEL